MRGRGICCTCLFMYVFSQSSMQCHNITPLLDSLQNLCAFVIALLETVCSISSSIVIVNEHLQPPSAFRLPSGCCGGADVHCGRGTRTCALSSSIVLWPSVSGESLSLIEVLHLFSWHCGCSQAALEFGWATSKWFIVCPIRGSINLHLHWLANSVELESLYINIDLYTSYYYIYGLLTPHSFGVNSNAHCIIVRLSALRCFVARLPGCLTWVAFHALCLCRL